MLKYVFLVLFIIVMVTIGLYSRRKVKDVQDFLFGGRQMGPWITAFAYGTTYFSAVMFIGYSGRIGWGFGISSTWIGIGNAVLGCWLAWKILAKRTRKMTHELDASTMPEFFEKRYDSKAMKIIASLLIFVFLVPYTASVYQGLGYLFQTSFNIPFEYGMLAMAVLTGIYLLLGGYVATAINDFIQGIIMIVGLILMVYFIVSHPAVGGISEGISRLSEIPKDGPNLVNIFSGMPLNLLGLVVLTSFGTWGLPQMVHKFYAIKDNNAIQKATIVSTVFAALIAGGAYFVGAFGRLFLENNPPLSDGKADLDMVMPLVLEKALPDALLGIILILVLSASMSTMASLVLVSSSSLSMDLIKGTIFPDMSKSRVMLIMRILCAVFIAFSFAVAIIPTAILTLMSFSWGTIAGCFLAPFIYGLYWKGTSRAGAWSGFIVGFTVSIGGSIITGMNTKLAPNIGAVAMVASLIAVPLVSKLTARYPDEHIDKVYGNKIEGVQVTIDA